MGQSVVLLCPQEGQAGPRGLETLAENHQLGITLSITPRALKCVMSEGLGNDFGRFSSLALPDFFCVYYSIICVHQKARATDGRPVQTPLD